MHLPLDYPTLRVIWWVLLGVLLMGFAVMDGFDFGIGMLLHRVARTNEERRIVLNTIGPVWEGNQIWLILGAGAIFAAWPTLYAVAFSGFYFAMLMVLFGLILRPVGFKYRSKIDSPRWRSAWDFCLLLGGLIPALIFGVAVGNVLQGVPFYFDDSMRFYYTGTLLGLLNPFALLCGALSIVMFIMHGAIFLAIKTQDPIQMRALAYARMAAILVIVLFTIGGFWVALGIQGYTLTQMIPLDGPSNPLHKILSTQTGAWISHYDYEHWTMMVPALGYLGALFAMIAISARWLKVAWLMSAFSIIGIIGTVGVSMFPVILPSSTHPNMSLLVWDSSSSHLTLFIMLVATVIFLPLILAYTSWVYYALRGKMTGEYVEANKSHLY